MFDKKVRKKRPRKPTLPDPRWTLSEINHAKHDASERVVFFIGVALQRVR